MVRAALILSAFLASHLSAAGDEPFVAPLQGAHPIFCKVKMLNKEAGQVVLLRFKTRVERVREVRKVHEKGVTRFIQEDRNAFHKTTYDEVVDLDDGSVFNTEGKPVKVADAMQRLRPGSMVLVSTDGEEVDTEYRRAIRPDILILVPKQRLFELE